MAVATSQWLGASARAFGGYPAVAALPNPYAQWLAAWGEVTERSFARMVAKPDWGIETIVGSDGRDHIVTIETEIARPFGDLIRFRVQGRPDKRRRILLIAPMSGHYATLLRSTVQSLLPDADVWITDWHNARDIPVSKGKFDVDDYTLYLADFIRHVGPSINVIADTQPADMGTLDMGGPDEPDMSDPAPNDSDLGSTDVDPPGVQNDDMAGTDGPNAPETVLEPADDGGCCAVANPGPSETPIALLAIGLVIGWTRRRR